MVEKITSKNNELVKTLKKLTNKKQRHKLGLFVIESKKLIEEAISSNMRISYIIYREYSDQIFSNKFTGKEVELSANIFDELSTLVTPDGYMALVEITQSTVLTDKLLILDQIQDPGNLGTMIRSAEAFGFNTIVSIDSVDFYNEKVLRSTMGSIFRLNLVEMSYEELSRLEGYTIFVADMDGEDYINVYTPDKLALVVGNEGNGISDQILQMDVKTIKIPMKGKIESLNAGVSASILMANFGKE